MGSETESPDTHDYHLAISLEGDGPGEAVDIEITVGNDETEYTVHPGEKVTDSEGDFAEAIELEIDYEDELDVELEWDVEDVSLEFDIEQEIWERTEGEMGFSIEDGRITFVGEATVSLPDSNTDMAVQDERTKDKWEYEVEIDVDDDGTDTELEFDVERDD